MVFVNVNVLVLVNVHEERLFNKYKSIWTHHNLS